MSDADKPTVLDPADIEPISRRVYPPPYDTSTDGRSRQVLGDNLGLTKFGVNITQLEPGAQSSLRHWHTGEDEFVYILEGEVNLVTDNGVTELGPGMVAGFPAGKDNAHHFVNRSKGIVKILEVGNRTAAEEVHYADADLRLVKKDGERTFTRKDGEPY